MSFPRYPKYKDSGVEWLGEVPEHWEVKPLGYLCMKIGSGKTPSGGAEAYSDHGIVFLRSQNVYDEGLFLDDVVFISEEIDAELSGSRVQVGDILLNITGASLGRTCLVPTGFPQANVNQHVCIIRLANSGERDFVAQSMKSLSTKAQIDAAQTGAAREGLNFAQISRLLVSIPPAEEQAYIVAFLDRETAKIDELVAEQRRLMELLKEKRQAVISHAVTRGLNPDAPLKPSGIEWLGDVPEHWEVKRLKNISPEITVGIVVEPSKHYCEEGVPALRSLNVRPGAISVENLVFISSESNELLSKSKLRAGDLVAVRSGQPGTTAVIPRELDGCNCIDLIIIRKPVNACEQFLCWYLASDPAVFQFSEGSGGAIQQHFNIGTAMTLVVCVPPISEQAAITTFLREETAKLDTLTAEAQRAIDLLQERRTALISAAVTGQIDVRQLAGEVA